MEMCYTRICCCPYAQFRLIKMLPACRERGAVCVRIFVFVAGMVVSLGIVELIMVISVWRMILQAGVEKYFRNV